MQSWNCLCRPWLRRSLPAASAVLLALAAIPASAQTAGGGMCAGGAGGGPGGIAGGGSGGAGAGVAGGGSSGGTSSLGLGQALLLAQQMQHVQQQRMQLEVQERQRLQQQMAPVLHAQAKQAQADQEAAQDRLKASRANRFRGGADRKTPGRPASASAPGTPTQTDLERQAEAKLRLARKLLAADRTAAARESLEQLVSDYKSTDAANAARKLLESL